MTNLEFWEQVFTDWCIDNEVELDVKIALLKKIQKKIQKELTLIQ